MGQTAFNPVQGDMKMAHQEGGTKSLSDTSASLVRSITNGPIGVSWIVFLGASTFLPRRYSVSFTSAFHCAAKSQSAAIHLFPATKGAVFFSIQPELLSSGPPLPSLFLFSVFFLRHSRAFALPVLRKTSSSCFVSKLRNLYVDCFGKLHVGGWFIVEDAEEVLSQVCKA